MNWDDRVLECHLGQSAGCSTGSRDGSDLVLVSWQSWSVCRVGDMAGGQKLVGGLAIGLWVLECDERASGDSQVLKCVKESVYERERTEVNNRPGSPKDDLQDISSLPKGMMLPGVCWTAKVGKFTAANIYMYCRMSCGCISACDPVNRLSGSVAPGSDGGRTLPSWTSQP